LLCNGYEALLCNVEQWERSEHDSPATGGSDKPASD
jgi:hypothetical protein